MTSAVANNTVKSKRSLRTVGSEVLVLLCSAFVYSMAFPGFMSADGIWILGFLSLIPVFAVIRRTSWKLVWAYGFMYGFVFYIFFDYWLKSFHPLAILLIPVIKGFEMIFLFIALKATAVFFRKLSPLFQAIVWVAYAYMAESWFAGVPYGNIAYVFYAVHPLVQIADITGVWGIVFLAILPQAYFGKFLAEYLEEGRGLKAYIKAEPFTLILWIALMVLDLVYGAVRLSEWTGKEPDRTWDVVAVQHNHDSWENGYATYLHNFNNLRRMTLESLQATDPDIVIWSETAFVPSVAWYTQYGPDNSLFQQQLDRLVDDFVAFGSGLGVPLLTGNSEGTLADPEQPPVLADGTSNRIDYNTVILFDDGGIKGTYRKQHLVPFTEHFPYEEELPWLYNLLLANDFNWWKEGEESFVFDSDGVHFSTPICFEDTFGYLSAEFVHEGADVIVNMTNDNWSKKVSAEMQHAAMASFRPVETRKSMIRGTNSGITCLITPDGAIHDKMPPFEMGWQLYHVPVYEEGENTFYTEHIDLFGQIAEYASYAILAAGAVLKAADVIRRRK